MSVTIDYSDELSIKIMEIIKEFRDRDDFRSLVHEFLNSFDLNDRKIIVNKMKILYVFLYGDNTKILEVASIGDKIISLKVEKNFYDDIVTNFI